MSRASVVTRLRMLLVVLIGLIGGLATPREAAYADAWTPSPMVGGATPLFEACVSASTTAASAASFTYDLPSATRLEVHEVRALQASSVQFSDTQEESVSRSPSARGASTTPTTRNHATNTASPVGEILRQDGVKIVIYSNDHAPPHAHVLGGGPETRIGQNGRPGLFPGDPELTKKQKQVVDDNLNTIRDAMRAYMAWYRENC